jgi:hypothetical protein
MRDEGPAGVVRIRKGAPSPSVARVSATPRFLLELVELTGIEPVTS